MVQWGTSKAGGGCLVRQTVHDIVDRVCFVMDNNGGKSCRCSGFFRNAWLWVSVIAPVHC